MCDLGGSVSGHGVPATRGCRGDSGQEVPSEKQLATASQVSFVRVLRIELLSSKLVEQLPVSQQCIHQHLTTYFISSNIGRPCI